MKQVVLGVLLLAGSAAQAQLQKRSFHRGAVVVQTGTGIEYFTTSKSYNSVDQNKDTMAGGQAAGANLNALLEIGITKRIGLGLRGKVNSYYTDIDKLINQRSTIRSADLMLNLTWHPIRREHFDFLFGTEFGMAAANVTFQNLGDLLSKGNGTSGALYIEPRFYKRNLGWFFRIGMPTTQFRSLTTFGTQLTSQQYALNDFKARGYSVSFGVQWKIN